MSVGAADLVLGAFLIVACVTDITKGKIPNALTFPMWGVGVVWWLVAYFVDGSEWWRGLLGLAVAFPIHFVLWQIKLDRGGDAKLMIGVGAMIGWVGLIEATLWHLVLMGPVAIVMITVLGRWPQFVASVKHLARKARGLPVGDPPEQKYIAKAPVIAAAVLVGRFTDWFDFISGGT